MNTLSDDDLNQLEKTLETFGQNATPTHWVKDHPRGDAERAAQARRRAGEELEGFGARKWQILAGGHFRPCGETTPALPAAPFKVFFDDQHQPVFKVLDLQTDELFRLPDSQTDRVLDSIEKFWRSKEKFVERGFLFKRGVLLTGAPGGGKTTCVNLLTEQLLKLGGIVVLGENPASTGRALEVLREIEPERPLICILEDLDELVRRYTEAEWLALLDGENQINNVCFIATTNYPQNLDRRFVNRPSRFDEIIEISMPTAAARRAYLERKLNPGDLSETEIDRWVADSDNFSVAHLRELYVSVFCLEKPYEEVIRRLQVMQKAKFKEHAANGAPFGAIGFGGKL